MPNAIAPASANIHQAMFTRYAKSVSHLFMPHQATGAATTNEIATNIINSFDSSCTRLFMLAPKTLRMPISFVRCSAIKVERPNKPRQAIRIASTENISTISPMRCSALYISLNESSKKRYLKGKPGAIALHLFFTCCTTSAVLAAFILKQAKPVLRARKNPSGPTFCLSDSKLKFLTTPIMV